MKSCLESLSTEILFEICDYLTTFDILRAFIDLNHWLDAVISSYSIRLDFQFVSRSKFDFICRHIHPEQVILLILSEKTIPDQVKLFTKYFPHFEHEFIRLKAIVLMDSTTILSNVPSCVSSLSFKRCGSSLNKLIIETIARQAKCLTHLRVTRSDTFLSVNASFHSLTHLTIRFCSLANLHWFIQRLGSSITHLSIFIETNNQEEENVLPDNFEQLPRCLTHLTLSFAEDINISFDSLERCLIQLHQLTHLIVEATGTLDLLDGARWEKLATRTQIEKFNFRLNFARGTTCNCDEKSLLEPFRSPFWLEQKRWFVAYHKQKWRHDNYLSIYTVPHFRPHSVQFPPSDYPPLSTAPAEIEQRIFYTSNIDHLFCDVVRLNLLSVHCFTKVNSLTIVGSVLPSFDNLKFIVDFDRVQNLDISGIDFLSANEFHNLVAHAGCLRHLTIKEFDPLLILPRHIYSLTIYRAVQSASINLFCHLLSHVEHLAMTVESKEIMIQLIDRLEHLETFSCSFSYKLPNLDDVSVKWLQQNTRRLKTNNFTCRIGVERIYLSIGDNW
ncbi:unnamed protein product [Rotaria magnacalcarata]|uniref:F-box domain-containing protein n=1 Tax=Rotaria magnacalcarata TaxID=392030 RepID=A0A816VHF1_9BILA|nr:unnamed protein product [Rotaria magnacalcarata]CAF2123022.1 unnamed protein product [Rotaria magnacalcarata]